MLTGKSLQHVSLPLIVSGQCPGGRSIHSLLVLQYLSFAVTSRLPPSHALSLTVPLFCSSLLRRRSLGLSRNLPPPRQRLWGEGGGGSLRDEPTLYRTLTIKEINKYILFSHVRLASAGYMFLALVWLVNSDN